jgi:AraC-like DNA-binding protein
MIAFGPWSTTLGLAAGFGCIVIVLLLTTAHNRAANRWLAVLVAVVVLRLVPYAIGYAGFYDAYPWLTFAPFDLSFAMGPPIWFYVWRLSGPALPRRWGWHLAPAALQFGYYSCCFVQPLAWKNVWDASVHEPWIDPFESIGAPLAMAAYLAASALRYREYQRWLVANVSDRDEHRQPWIRNALVALALTWSAIVGFEVTQNLVVRLNYFDRFPLYLGFAALILYLGLEGWRHANHRFPEMVDLPERDVAGRRNWTAQGHEWANRIDAGEWWREPALSVAQVARRLGTNQSYVSRAINEGLGTNFNALINAMRVAAVQARLREIVPGDDLLALAFDAGFSSKASFNRAFRAHTGMTPSAFRASQIQ